MNNQLSSLETKSMDFCSCCPSLELRPLHCLYSKIDNVQPMLCDYTHTSPLTSIAVHTYININMYTQRYNVSQIKWMWNRNIIHLHGVLLHYPLWVESKLQSLSPTDDNVRKRLLYGNVTPQWGLPSQSLSRHRASESVAKVETFHETNKKIAKKSRKNLKSSDLGQKEVPFRAKWY